MDPEKGQRTYMGCGTADDPYVVDWDLNDPEDPYNWPTLQRWIITAQVRSFLLIISIYSFHLVGFVYIYCLL